MAGNGPPPKDPSKRARTNKDIAVMRILPAILSEQPPLPEFDISRTETDEYGESVTLTERFEWPEITKQWWQMWADSPLSAEFTSTDWSELRDTAFLHANYWSGKLSLAGELRLRTAKFGATPEDRLRLRIQFAQAVEGEARTVKRQSSRDRFGVHVTKQVEA